MLPNVFELCCDGQKKIDECREIFDLKQRVKNGIVSKEDYNYLVNKIGINNDALEPLLSQLFASSGRLFDNYNENKKRNK